VVEQEKHDHLALYEIVQRVGIAAQEHATKVAGDRCHREESSCRCRKGCEATAGPSKAEVKIGASEVRG